MGPVMYADEEGEVFLGMSGGVKPKAFSDDTARAIDVEVRNIIDDCYGAASRLLKENEDKLHKMAEALIELETLNSDQIDDIMAGAKPRDSVKVAPPSSSSSSQEGDDKESPIGGPAEDH
jgi:cell division protease FtsH